MILGRFNWLKTQSIFVNMYTSIYSRNKLSFITISQEILALIYLCKIKLFPHSIILQFKCNFISYFM